MENSCCHASSSTIALIVNIGPTLKAQDTCSINAADTNTDSSASLMDSLLNSGNISPNFTEWADVFQLINNNCSRQNIPNFTQWSDDVCGSKCLATPQQ